MKALLRPALLAALASLALALPSQSAFAVDANAALSLARQNNCFRCHTIAKESDKDGPPYNKVAEKYKGKPGAEQRLIEHITSGEMATFKDGHKEAHKIVKTSPPKDMNQIKNLVQWILAQ
ncbi:MAG: c-type cytochrome [Burkholderiales bacterium]